MIGSEMLQWVLLAGSPHRWRGVGNPQHGAVSRFARARERFGEGAAATGSAGVPHVVGTDVERRF
jgi:hypothetical protein